MQFSIAQKIHTKPANRYGQPSDRVLQSLQSLGVSVLRTDELGNIVLKSDGSTVTISSTKSDITE